MTHSIRLWILVPLFLLLASVAFAQNKKGPTRSHPDEEAMMRAIKVTRWADPQTEPDTYLDYLAARAVALDGPFSARIAYQSPAEVYASKQRVDLLLEAGLYEDLQADTSTISNAKGGASRSGFAKVGRRQRSGVSSSPAGRQRGSWGAP